VGQAGSSWSGGGGTMQTGSGGRAMRAAARTARSTTLSIFVDCPVLSIH